MCFKFSKAVYLVPVNFSTEEADHTFVSQHCYFLSRSCSSLPITIFAVSFNFFFPPELWIYQKYTHSVQCMYQNINKFCLSIFLNKTWRCQKKIQNHCNLKTQFHAEEDMTTYFPQINYHLIYFFFCYLNNLNAIRQNNSDISVSNLQSLT